MVTNRYDAHRFVQELFDNFATPDIPEDNQVTATDDSQVEVGD